MDRYDRNHASKQGCPFARRDLKKADDEILEATNSKRISGQCVGNPASDGDAQSSFRWHAGRSDASGRRRHVLPQEISDLVGAHADYRRGNLKGRDWRNQQRP